MYNYNLLPVQQFSIEAFQFIASHPVVYIHCDAIVCHNSTKLSRCSQGCVPGPGLGRKRRELGPEVGSSSAHYVVSEGPLRFDADSSEDKGKGVAGSRTDAIRTTPELQTTRLNGLHKNHLKSKANLVILA